MGSIDAGALATPPVRTDPRVDVRASDASPGSTGRGRAVLGVLLAGLMLLPCIVAIACLAGRPWLPVDDLASIDLHVRDVWSLHPPLTGLYSRPPWNHPGPLMFWLMGLVSLPTGRAAWATHIGGALLQGLALGWLAWLAWRRGLPTLLAAAAVTAAAFAAGGAGLVRDPWNPYVPIGFFVLFLFLTWFVATGSFRLLIAMVFVGSFAVQAHVSYALLVAAGFAFAIGYTLVDARRHRHGPPRWRSTVLISGGVGTLCWIGPAIDLVVHRPGNLTKIVRYFEEGGYPRVGLRSAVSIMATEFHAVPTWAGGHDSVAPFTGFVKGTQSVWLLLGIALLAVGLIAARAAGLRDNVRMVSLAALMLVVGIVDISGADGARGYTFGWRPVIAVFVVVASLWSIAGFAAPRLPRVARRVGPAFAVGATAWACVGLAVAIPSAQPAGPTGAEAAMSRVSKQIEHEGLPRRTLLLRSTGEQVAAVFRGTLDWLDRRGVDVRVDPGLGRLYGYQRTIEPARAGATWYVTEHGSFAGELLRLPGARLVAAASPLSPDREVELTRLQAQVWDQLRRGGHADLLLYLDSPLIGFRLAGVAGVDKPTVARMARLGNEVIHSGTCRCAVVEVPTGSPDPLADLPSPR